MGINKMKLNLGCGHQYMDGWVNVDAPKDELCYDDLKADVYAKIEDLNYEENSVDEILLNAVFEHFPRHVAIVQLRKFYKWLKPDGGKLTILVQASLRSTRHHTVWDTLRRL
jgi:predicted SAM-dependent methyltransferase